MKGFRQRKWGKNGPENSNVEGAESGREEF